MLTESLINKLQKIGFSRDVDLQKLLDEFPEHIWISSSEKNLKRKPATILIFKKDGKYTVTLSVVNDKDAEVYNIESVIDKKLDVALAKMILLLDREQLLNPTI